MSTLLDLDHESGALDEYTTTVTGSGDLTAAAAAALAGTAYGMAAEIDDTGGIYGEADFTQLAADGWRMRLYLDPNSLTMASGNAFWFCGLYYNTGSRMLLELRHDGTHYEVRAELQNDAAGWHRTGYYDISDAPHYIEIDVQRASSAVASDATIQLWIDGTSQETIASIDLHDLSQPNRLRLGAIAGLDAATGGTLYLDQLILNDTHQPIGPHPPGSPGAGPASCYRRRRS